MTTMEEHPALPLYNTVAITLPKANFATYKVDFYEDTDGYSDFKDSLEKLLHSNEPSDVSLLKKFVIRFNYYSRLAPNSENHTSKNLKDTASSYLSSGHNLNAFFRVLESKPIRDSIARHKTSE